MNREVNFNRLAVLKPRDTNTINIFATTGILAARPNFYPILNYLATYNDESWPNSIIFYHSTF